MAYASISKPSLYFNTKLYTGDQTSSSHSITGVGFAPDFVWIKDREDTSQNTLTDKVRGATKTIASDSTEAESTNPAHLQSFDSDGFTVGANNRVNQSGVGNASWNWKANGAGSANTDGSINTTATSVNTTAGFSIVKYVGNDTAGATVGHGLGAVPKMIIIKRLSGSAQNWCVYHYKLGNTDGLYLNDTASTVGSNTFWNNTTPTSSVFTLGSSSLVNGGGGSDSYIAYCFAEKKGYSKFGSYTGNGNADGTFVYTGFSPAYVVVKRTDAVESWFQYDNKRNAHVGNERYYVLRPNTNSVENTTYSDNWQMDFLSNGFKLRASAGHLNSGNLIYMAFAAEPLVANVGASIPATAR